MTCETGLRESSGANGVSLSCHLHLRPSSWAPKQDGKTGIASANATSVPTLLTQPMSKETESGKQNTRSAVFGSTPSPTKLGASDYIRRISPGAVANPHPNISEAPGLQTKTLDYLTTMQAGLQRLVFGFLGDPSSISKICSMCQSQRGDFGEEALVESLIEACDVKRLVKTVNCSRTTSARWRLLKQRLLQIHGRHAVTSLCMIVALPPRMR